MKSDPKDVIFGTKMSEWISRVPNELTRDAVGLWQIVPDGELNFRLSGFSLAEFVRRNIVALIDAGAIPVAGGKGTGYEWVYQPQFGTTKEDIVRNVVAEWQRIGNNVDELMGSVWFARPRPGTKYIKMD